MIIYHPIYQPSILSSAPVWKQRKCGASISDMETPSVISIKRVSGKLCPQAPKEAWLWQRVFRISKRSHKKMMTSIFQFKPGNQIWPSLRVRFFFLLLFSCFLFYPQSLFHSPERASCWSRSFVHPLSYNTKWLLFYLANLSYRLHHKYLAICVWGGSLNIGLKFMICWL